MDRQIGGGQRAEIGRVRGGCLRRRLHRLQRRSGSRTGREGLSQITLNELNLVDTHYTVETAYKVYFCPRGNLLLYADLPNNRPKVTLKGHIGAFIYLRTLYMILLYNRLLYKRL